MSEDKDTVQFKMLDYKLIGSDTITFRLEDGAIGKIKVDLDRAGVAENFKNQLLQQALLQSKKLMDSS